METNQPTQPKPKRRWFYPTPGRLLVILLAVEGILLLSERFQWFAFNQHKGWTVLIAVATVGLFLLLSLIWFIFSLIFRWYFQFSIRSLLILTIAVAIPFSWLAVEMKLAKRQRAVVEVLRKSGGIINYNCQVFIESDIIGNPNLVLSTLSIEHSAPLIMEQVKAPGPVWLRDFMGIEFVSDVVDVVLDSLTDDEMKYFVDLPKVHSITILNSNISDAGLNHLEGLTQLRILNLRGTKVTDAGVNELQDALPNLKIERR